MKARASIRLRIALWCAALVSVTGALTTLILLFATQHELHAGKPVIPLDGREPAPVVVHGETMALLHAIDLLIDGTVDRLRVVGLVGVLALALASIAIGWLVAGRMLRPAASLAQAAAAISPTSLSRRINSSGPNDELRAIADAFDAMLDRIDTGFERQQRFVADASHELRTPFAAMRAHIDVALERPSLEADEARELLETLGKVLDRGAEMVDAMLSLSRAEAPLRREPVDLADVVGELITAMPAAATFDLQLQLAPLVVEGDPVLLTQLAANLIENAAAYNRPGGLLLVETSASRFVVENDGPPVDPAQIPRLTERFHRADGRTRESGGFGLGLSVVSTIVETHQATLEISPRAAGGLRISVAFMEPVDGAR